MQHAKDSLFATLRQRLAAVAPQRMIQLADSLAHIPAPPPTDCFVLRFCEASVAATFETSRPLMRLACVVEYRTRGTDDAAATRGRTLGAMDAELLAVSTPPSTAKFDHTCTPPRPLGTRILWSAPRLGEVKQDCDMLARTATFDLFFYPEALLA